MEKIRARAIAGLKTGDTFCVKRTFSQGDVEAFGDISRDFNAVHYDERFAAVKKLRGPICHGLLVASILTEIGGQISWLASSMHFTFKRPVYAGETVECRLTIKRIDERNWAEAEAVFTNQDDVTVIEAFLTGYVPGRPEREVLRAIVADGDPTNKVTEY